MAQHVRSSTFGQYRNSRCAVGGKTSIRTCWSWSLDFLFIRPVAKDLAMRTSRIETISRVCRLGRAVRHSTKSSITLQVPPSKSTTRVLRTVRASVRLSQIHERRAVPHVDSEMRGLQQNLTSGQKLRFNLRFVPHPAHGIVSPCLHKNRLPHHSTRRAQSQQRPRSFPEGLRKGPVPPVFMQVSTIHIRPGKDGQIMNDLLEKFVR